MAIVFPLGQPPHLCTATSHPESFGEDGMTLEAMQAVVGGYIEHVQLHPPIHMDGQVYVHLVCNEEGKLQHLPANPVATALARKHGLPHDTLVGAVILLTQDEMQ